jgi:hypothetical protein
MAVEMIIYHRVLVINDHLSHYSQLFSQLCLMVIMATERTNDLNKQGKYQV